MMVKWHKSFQLLMSYLRIFHNLHILNQLFKSSIHLDFTVVNVLWEKCYATNSSYLQKWTTGGNFNLLRDVFCSNFLLSLLWEFCRGNLVESWLFLGNGVIKEMFHIYSQQLWISIMEQTRNQNATKM